MIQATSSIQLAIVDSTQSLATQPPLLAGGQPIQCPGGVVTESVTLAPGTSNLSVSFPAGVTTAAYVFIAAVTATDLIVNIGSTPFAMHIPANQGILLYGVTSAQVSLSTTLGGEVTISVGG